MLESIRQIRLGALAGPLGALEAVGVDGSQILASSAVSAELASSPEEIIGSSDYLEVMARVVHASRTDAFMVHSGINLSLENIGLSGKAVLSATTVREALTTAHSVLSYLQSDSGIAISTAMGRCRVSYYQGLGTGEEIVPDLQYTTGIIANLVCCGRHTSDPELTVGYPGARNTYHNGLPSSAAFKNSIEGFIEFDERALKSPMPLANSNQTEVLNRFVTANTIDQASNLNVSATVSQLIYHSFGIVRPSQTVIANMLDMNTRALQRALKLEETSFRQILENARQTVAMEDLMSGQNVTDTAFKLGFDYPQNFTSAFQDWFGRAPSSV